MSSWGGSSWAGSNKWQSKTAGNQKAAQPTSGPPQQQGAKRALTPTPAGGAKPATPPAGAKGAVKAAGTSGGTLGKVAFKVSTVSKKGDLIATTLIGDYEEKGTHHGKKCYQKIGQIPGHPGVKVFLYYFDARDGQELSGWWFGDALGGSQVWARAAVHTPTPPKVAWRVPWDAPTVQPGALLVDPAGAAASAPAAPAATPTPAAASPAAATPAVTAAALAQRLKKATGDVASAETVSNASIAAAKKAIENEKATEAMLKGNSETLLKQQTKLNDLNSSLLKDIAEARKGGVPGASVVTELTKLLPKVKTLQASIVVEMGKLKARQTKAASEKQKAEAEKKKKDLEEQQKKKEEKDAKEFQQLLGKTKTALAEAEAAAASVVAKASPLVATGEASDAGIEGLQKEAVEADKKLMDVRTEVQSKLMSAIKGYAPQAKKDATVEVQLIQNKAQEAQKKVNAYKNFKKDFQSFVDARTAAAEVSEKIEGAVSAIVKAEKMVVPAKVSKMTEEDIAEVDAVTTPALAEINAAMALVTQKSKGSSNAMQAALAEARTRIAEARQKLDVVTGKLKDRRQELEMLSAVSKANDLVAAVEGSLDAMQQAEMPFLKGLEVLPKEESDKALADSDAAYSTTHKAIIAARTFMKARLADSKKCTNKELAKNVGDVFPMLFSKIDAIDVKLTKFQKETAERRVSAMLADLAGPVVEAEGKLQALKDMETTLTNDLDETSIDGIKAAIEKCSDLERDALASYAGAKKLIATKQSSLRSPDAVSGVNKIDRRLSAVQGELSKHKKLVDNANKAIKAKQVLEQEGPTLAAAEADVQKAESLTPSEDAEFTVSDLKAMEEASANASKSFKTLLAAVQPILATAPGNSKAALQKLLDGAKAGQEKLATLKTSTKSKREKALVGVFSQESEAKVAAVEANVERMSEAELPFLKGIEVLPLKETQHTITESHKTITDTQEAIAQAKSYIAAKSLEARSFAKEFSQELNTAFAGLNSRITAAQQKLSSFTKDTAERKKGCDVQEAGEMVTELEDHAKKILAVAEPFMKEEAEKMSDEDAWEPLKLYLEVEKVAKEKLSATSAFVNERQRVSKDNAAHKEIISKLLERLTAVKADMIKASAATAPFEKRFLAKRVLEEVKEKVGTLDNEVKSATDACAALLERKGEEFLVQTSIRTLAKALTAHMQGKNMDVKALFDEVAKGKKVKTTAFIKYLMDLPARIEHDEIAFTEERCAAIFNQLDITKKGIGASEFGGIFCHKGVCRKSVPLTDNFSLSECTTVAKLEVGDLIEVLGPAKTDGDGMVRCEAQTSGDDKKIGWVTIQSNTKTQFIDEVTSYSVFCKDAEKALAEASSNLNKVSAFLLAKSKEGGAATTGSSLAEAREEIAKLKPTVTSAIVAIDSLKKKFADAKRELAEKDKREREAHIHAKNAKAAEVYTSVAVAAVEEAIGASKAVDDHASPFTSVDAAQLEAFETPDSLLETVETLSKAAIEKAENARKVLREQLQEAAKVSPPTGASLEAKRVLMELQAKLNDATKSSKKELDAVRSRCKLIANKAFDTAKEALQKELEGAGGNAEAFFAALSGGKQEVSQDSFTNKLISLKGSPMKPEHAKLVCKRVADGDGGISRSALLTLVQRYAQVVKDVALTADFDVNTTTTIRKLEKDELLEVLEGPKKDDALGVERVRVKSLLDVKQGWVTVKGNQGTSFLKELPKPFYKVFAETTLENGASSCVAVRTLPVNEVLELIEGPQHHVFADISFAKVKATKDGAIGWVIVVDSSGAECVEPNKKLFTCKAVVAITDVADVKESKVLRKLAIGELFEAMAPIEVDEASGVSRVKGRAPKDEVIGWITVKGNAGTAFAELNSKNFVVAKAVDLQKRCGSAGKGEVTRKLEAGESLQLLEGPTVEKAVQQTRLKVRAQSDFAEGWITKDVKVRPFQQKC